jgi:hypothetical protein
MSVRRTLALGLAAPLLLPLLLSACGGGDVSVADPPISSAPTSSPTSSTRESPEHFIRRFAQEERTMENTGDVRRYLELTPSCEPCKGLARQIQGFYQAGGYVHWAGWDIKAIRPYEHGSRANSFAVRVDSAPTTYRESSNGPLRHLEGGLATEIVSIKLNHGAWLVTGRAKLST